MSGRAIIDFLLNPSDEAYRRWWPGTHLSFHTIAGAPGETGSVVFFDERVGARRVKMTAVVREAIPGKRVVWQLKHGLRLPAWLVLEVEDVNGGVTVTHTIRAGFRGMGRIFDPLLRLYFSPAFQRAMDDHVATELHKLGELLHAR